MIESSKNINKSELQKIRSLQSGFSSFLKYAQQKENECVKIIKDDSTTFRVNKGLEVSGWVKAVEIGGTILIVGGLIVSAVLTGGSSLLICASIGAAAGAGMGYYKNRDSKNPWGHALFGAIKGGATGAMMSQMGPQLLAAGSQLSTVGLSGAALKTAGLKYVAEIFTKTTLKETVIGVAGQGIYQTVDSGIEGFIDNGVEGFKTNVVNALKQFNDPMNLIKTIGLTAVLAPGLRRISAIDKTKVPKGLDDSINNQAELRQRILKNIEESRKARESSGYKEWATEGVTQAERLIPGTPGVVTGGNSTKLGKNIMESMGLKRSTKWTGYQAQHIIPAEMADNPILKKIGMNLDDATNGILLRTPDAELSAMSRHRGYHSVYNDVVRNQLNNMDINQSVDVLQRQVLDLQSDLRKLQESGLPLYPSQGATVDLWERSLNRIRK